MLSSDVIVIMLSTFFVPGMFTADDWWKHTIIYEIYPRSFKDSNGDGVGDLRGIKSKLDHFVDLGVESIYIAPFYKSPMLDNGYDISDYTSVDGVFGTMEDFDELMKELNKRGMKLILDLVPNHTSDEHDWFQKSLKKIDPYTDYYVWKDPKGKDINGNPIPPNNWLSIFGNTAWEWSKERQQFYLHQFGIQQPDLNVRNPAVFKALTDVVDFWFDKGADGFRIDATKHLFEDAEFRDEPYISEDVKGSIIYVDMIHIYTTDLEENYKFIHDLRVHVDNKYEAKDGHTRILVPEAYTDEQHTRKYYDSPDYKVTQFPFNFVLTRIQERSPNATYLDKKIHTYLATVPEGAVTNWVAENHDNPRIASWLGPEFVDIINTLTLFLPGVGCIYYGQEIGLNSPAIIRPDQRQDKQNSGDRDGSTRDAERCPMQWDDSLNSGFTTAEKPWLPVNPDYWHNNVKRQKNTKRSHYNYFKELVKLRKTKSFLNGDLKTSVLSSWAYAVSRHDPEDDQRIAVINLGTETEIINIEDMIQDWPKALKVITCSENAQQFAGDLLNGKHESEYSFLMRPRSVVMLTPTDEKEKEIKKNAGTSLNNQTHTFLMIVAFTSLVLSFSKSLQ